MESSDIVDDVNALLKLGVGDPYRLEHIKQAYLKNKTLWETDKIYLKRLKEKYLTKQRPAFQPDVHEKTQTRSEKDDFIHCWNCGKQSPLGGNFCMACGSALFEIGKVPPTKPEQTPSTPQSKPRKIGIKIPIIIGIPVLILAIVGGAASQGLLDDVIDSDSTVEPKSSAAKTTAPTETSSKCGKGTVFDPKTNSCVLER